MAREELIQQMIAHQNQIERDNILKNSENLAEALESIQGKHLDYPYVTGLIENNDKAVYSPEHIKILLLMESKTELQEFITEYSISIKKDQVCNSTVLALIDKTKHSSGDSNGIMKSEEPLIYTASKEENETILRQFNDLNIELEIKVTKELATDNVSVELLDILYKNREEYFKPNVWVEGAKSRLFTFTKHNVLYELVIHTGRPGNTFHDILRTQEAFGDYIGSELDYQAGSVGVVFNSTVLKENLDKTLEIFQSFAESQGFNHVRSMGFTKDEGFEKQFYIWVGNKIGDEKVTFASFEEECVELLVNDFTQFSEKENVALENTVLYGGEYGIEMYYFNGKGLNGTDESIRKYLSEESTGGIECEPLNEIMPVTGTLLESEEVFNTINKTGKKLFSSTELEVSFMEHLMLHRVCARLETGSDFKDSCKPDDFKVLIMFHGAEDRIDWSLRNHAARTLEKTFEEYAESWLEYVVGHNIEAEYFLFC